MQNERVLTAGTGISITDAGAGSTVTIAATGGGGGSSVFNPVIPSKDLDTTGRDNMYLISKMIPWGSNGSGNTTLNPDSNPKFWPFLSPITGDIDKLVVNVITDGTSENALAIYSDSGGFPDVKIGGDFTYIGGTGGTGSQQLTPASTVALTQGTQYWIGIVDTTNGTTTFSAESNASSYFVGPISPNQPLTSPNQGPCLLLINSSNVMPAGPVNAASTELTTVGCIRFGIIYA